MRHGFIGVGAYTPYVKVGDTKYNTEEIIKRINVAERLGTKVIVLPELCITGYTCGDLFYQELLLRKAKEALLKIAAHSEGKDYIAFVGLPIAYNGKLYNVAAAISGGSVLGLVPKTHIPNYNEFYEARHFTKGMEQPVPVEIDENHVVPMGTHLIFSCRQMPSLKIGVEICEDLWAPNPPSVGLAMAGADLIVNLSASDETVGKADYRRDLVKSQSARLVCGYVYCSAGNGESTQDVVYSGHNIIAENGTVLKSSRRFINDPAYTEVDVNRLLEERRRMTTFQMDDAAYMNVEFNLTVEETKLTRPVWSKPFVPVKRVERFRRCNEILTIQASGLKQRLKHTRCKTAVIGISGGLDSTLALLVTIRAFEMLGKDKKDIIAVTMPGFGTTDRTYDNAVHMIGCVGATLMEINIGKSVTQHFEDIGQDMSVHDVTYENGQARERTQILMDIANKTGGMVIGTGDMSELALGWATYNGDHMSMYGVNASVPKTLVRYLVEYYAYECCEDELAEVLKDVLDTPVSPELLPPEDGQISQKTEDLVGPYELHDFFLYYVLRFGFEPKKIYRLARYVFYESYDDATILKWMKTFYRRFFNQQFKRSCLPDGPKVGTVAVSPRGDLRMPSDACAQIWLDELEGDMTEPEQKKNGFLDGDWSSFASQMMSQS